MSTEIAEPAPPPTIRLSDFLERTREQLTSQASGLLAPRYTADHHAVQRQTLTDHVREQWTATHAPAEHAACTAHTMTTRADTPLKGHP